jgi:hypothetical protein
MEAGMGLRHQISLFTVVIAAQLLLFGNVRADDVKRPESLTKQESVMGPEQHDMTLVASEPWVVEGEVFGVLAGYVYKDVSTRRPVDYWELYDTAGDLLAVSWFDRFGIHRTAVDRGIMQDGEKLDGVFVIVLDGETL